MATKKKRKPRCAQISCQPRDSRRAFFRRKPRQHFPHSLRIEHRVCLPNAHAAGRKPQHQTPPVACVALTRDIPFAHKLLDLQRHRRWSHSHVPCQFQQHHRLALIQVIQNAPLVRAQHPLRFRIPYVTPMAREVNPRVQLHQLLDSVALHTCLTVNILL